LADRRAAARAPRGRELARSPRLSATLVDALAGMRPPQTALVPAVLGKLVL